MFTGVYSYSFNEIGAIPLHDGDLSFEIYIDDEEFENDNNPWGEIKLHKYINMND